MNIIDNALAYIFAQMREINAAEFLAIEEFFEAWG